MLLFIFYGSLLLVPYYCVDSLGNNLRIVGGRCSSSALLLRHARSQILQRSLTTSYHHPPFATLSSNEDDDDVDDDFFSTIISEDLLEASNEKLLWEVVREKEQRPVLNLSARDLSPEDVDEKQQQQQQQSKEESSSPHRENGEVWKTTQMQLTKMGLFSSSSSSSNGGKDEDSSSSSSITRHKLLHSVPQLLRLDTTMVMETAQVLLEEFHIPPALLLQESPQLLSFPPEDVRYGVEFLSLMMMMPSNLVLSTCQRTPALLRGGVEGGLQERTVQKALGAAAAATTSANHRIAADAVATLDQLRRTKKNSPPSGL